jgi:putative oxidoreductase
MVERKEVALLIMRLVVGTVFLLHGSQKLFGVFGGTGLSGYVSWLAGIGVNSALAYLSAAFEFAAGISLIFGIAVELGALMGLCMMIGAIYLVHGSHGYFIQNNGFEYALNLGLLCIAIAIGGPGMWYLWDPFKTVL